MRLWDRSRTQKDWDCQRARYYAYEWGGKGLSPDTTSLELMLGNCVHSGLAVMAAQQGADGVDIDAIAAAAREEILQAIPAESEAGANFQQEQAALIEGLLRGFFKFQWPRLMEAYPKILLIEQEMTYEHDGLTFMAKPDLVVEDAEGEVWYIEYKTTSSKKPEWINGWNTAIQLHSSLRAIESYLGRKPAGTVVQGLYKGYVDSYEKQSSPFCYAYTGRAIPPAKPEALYAYKPGLRRTPTWLLPKGVAGWVDGMPDEVLAEQFPQTPPIYVKDDMVSTFFKQRSIRETEIAYAIDAINCGSESYEGEALERSFPQNFSSCAGKYGRVCEFAKLCFGQVEDPLQAGYEYRQPHHTTEVAFYKSKEDVK